MSVSVRAAAEARRMGREDANRGPGHSLRLGGRRAELPRRLSRGPQAVAPPRCSGRLALDRKSVV